MVILIIFLSSTVAEFLAQLHDKRYVYNFQLLSGAAALMYGYTSTLPVALWGTLRWYGSDSVSLLEYLTLYGYANLIWMPVAVVSASPLSGKHDVVLVFI